MSDYLISVEVEGPVETDDRGYDRRQSMMSVKARVTPELAYRIAGQVNSILAEPFVKPLAIYKCDE